MCDEKTLNDILVMTVDRFEAVFGNSLKTVYLYGSYARGDQDSESDIDVVALVDLDRADLSRYCKEMVSLSSSVDLEYNVMLSPSALPYREYEKYKNDLPYFMNIQQEGIVLRA